LRQVNLRSQRALKRLEWYFVEYLDQHYQQRHLEIAAVFTASFPPFLQRLGKCVHMNSITTSKGLLHSITKGLSSTMIKDKQQNRQ
jgi:hypothetical protein